MKPFRFGILSGADSAESLTRMAVEAEARGYSTLALSDHIDLSGGHVARLSWLPALSYVAASTTTLRLTTMVANQDLRHPAVLAREIASLDLLSDGRFEFGLGAGWNPVEYAWAGIALDPPSTRIRRLREYLAVVRGLLDGATAAAFDFVGDFFTIAAMPRVPASRQRPLPVMLGGSQRGMLTFAAGSAEIVNILTLRETGSVDEVLSEKVPWINEAAAVAGRDPEIATSVVLVATNAADPVSAVATALPHSRFAQHVAQSQSLEAISRAPHVLAGDSAQIAEELQRRREAWGVSYYVLPAESMEAFQPILDRLAGT